MEMENVASELEAALRVGIADLLAKLDPSKHRDIGLCVRELAVLVPQILSSGLTGLDFGVNIGMAQAVLGNLAVVASAEIAGAAASTLKETLGRLVSGLVTRVVSGVVKDL